MPTSYGLVGNESVTVLKDTTCSEVIAQKYLVKEEQLTGKVGYITRAPRTLLKKPYANVEVCTPYFSGRVEALRLKNSLYEPIIENISGAKALDDTDET